MDLVGCEWGERGAELLAPESDVLVVVDVLSFSSCVDIAVSRRIEVLPFAGAGDEARDFARRHGAELALPRGQGRYSLSPESFMLGAPGARVVLPSPNGARVALAPRGCTVLAGCLRNAAAVAGAARRASRRIAVIPAGERWPDGSLRPGVEDWLGAGAILARLPGARSPGARAAVAAFRDAEDRLLDTLSQCPSGIELIERGYPEDVALCAALDVSESVPVLRGAAFTAFR